MVETVVNVVVGKGAYIMSVFIFPVLPPPSFPYLSSLYPQSPFVRTLSTVNAAKLTPGEASLRTATKICFRHQSYYHRTVALSHDGIILTLSVARIHLCIDENWIEDKILDRKKEIGPLLRNCCVRSDYKTVQYTIANDSESFFKVFRSVKEGRKARKI
ncbi:hypothetical protein V1478_006033 [Vespula squamosa]|uniref:Uncharacterized protein n=1 Tax=Vespula squamosa TaxID=30214 RepID=A0ABD2B937_VESSQ